MSAVSALLRARRARWIVLGLLIAVPLWWFAIMAPLGSRLAGATLTRANAQLSNKALLVELSELRGDRKSASAAERYLQHFSAAVPSSADAPGLVVQVYDLAHRDGVLLTSITDNTVVANAGYSTIPVAIQASGSRDALVSFVDGLYRLPRLLTIQSLTLSGSGDLNKQSNTAMTTTISATAYTLAAVPSGPGAHD